MGVMATASGNCHDKGVLNPVITMSDEVKYPTPRSEVQVPAASHSPAYSPAPYGYDAYEKYYKHACEVCVPIVLKVPVFVSPIVIEKAPLCAEKIGY
jgi:hypothetical protein